ncbi:LTA synthase family protein [Thermotoga sp. KOL6]|uniref:LTA synthase family protein n=1 Tax=Thermotoga sp. KOL6 TaxID=126741 RepID=UPI000C76C278|nr:LTA synthase family protein [Thermotoga sp. KOL6]PLV60088.1 sulfatase [Thermotoga sp. KOL6]
MNGYFLMILLAVKLVLFYVSTLNSFGISVVFSTIGWVSILFLVFKGGHRLLYTVLSILLFIDYLYFQNFGNLPSITAITLLPQVGEMGRDIKYFIDFYSLLFLADLPFVWLFFKETRREKFGLPFIGALVLSFVFIGAIHTSQSLDSKFVFNRYGVFDYHLQDIIDLFFSEKKKEENTGSPIVEKNPVSSHERFFGIARGKNIIVVQMESLQNFLVGLEVNGQEITPNINAFLRDNDTLYFSKCYQQVGSGNTADAEFVVNTSLHTLGDSVVYEEYPVIKLPTLPKIMKANGYHTIAFHGNVAWFWNREEVYKHIGFDEFVSLEDFKPDEIFGMGLADVSFFKQSMERLKNFPRPFYAFLITISSHTPFVIPEEHRKLDLPEEIRDTIVGHYLQSVHYADEAFGIFLDELKRSGLYDNTVIILYGDHAGLYPFNREVKSIMPKLLGKEYSFDIALNIPFAIHVPGSNIHRVVETVGGQIDFLPTILNILGIEYKEGFFMGQDLLNTKHGFVALRYHVPDGSFIDDERVFIVSWDGRLDKSFYLNKKTGEGGNYVECLDGYVRAIQQIEASKYFILRNCEPLAAEEQIHTSSR